jgi:hypothetical protein
MQRIHSTDKIIGHLLSVWYFFIIGYQIVAGIVLISLGLIIELFKALKDMRKKEKITTPPRQHLYPNNWSNYVRKTSKDSERDLAMRRWRKS